MTRTPARFLTRAILAALVTALIAGAVSAREVHEDQTIATRIRDVRLAIALEEYENAVRVAEALHADYPDDEAVFWTLVRAYASAGRDAEELIPLLRGYLDTHPGDRRATLELGSALAREGRHDDAHETWLGPLRGEPADIGGYSEVGSLEMRNRMHEHAIETYLEGRERAGEPGLFSRDLALAYVATGQYDESVAECLLAIEQNPGFVPWAMNLVETVLETTGNDDLALRWAERIVDDEAVTPQELSFAGSLYTLAGRLDDALDAHTLADERGGRRGMELLDHARLLTDRGMLEEADRALGVLFEHNPTAASAAAASRERAGILVALEDPVGAVRELKRLAETFERRPERYEALIEAAEIELHQLDDPAAALATLAVFQEEEERIPRPTFHEAGLVEVDARVARGEFEIAYSLAGGVIAGGAEKETAERARYARGFVSFLMGEQSRALTELREMVEQHTGGGLANDAIRLMLVISDALESGDAEQASLYAEALRAEATGDLTEAERLLDDVAARYPGTTVAAEALMRRGALAEREGEIEDALAAYARASERSESIVVRAESMMRRGRILVAIPGRREAAAAEFQAVLDELPPNHLSGEARRALEELRRGRNG